MRARRPWRCPMQHNPLPALPAAASAYLTFFQQVLDDRWSSSMLNATRDVQRAIARSSSRDSASSRD
jgi:hypothetical protein